jgi:hypothetical protein
MLRKRDEAHLGTALDFKKIEEMKVKVDKRTLTVSLLSDGRNIGWTHRGFVNGACAIRWDGGSNKGTQPALGLKFFF